MGLKDLSIEQLEEREQELHDNVEQNDGYYSQLVNIYEEMHKRLSPLARKDPERYGGPVNYTKKLLVSYLIKYGTYLKMNNMKDDKLAVNSLKKALRFDPTNPMAHYRLGFLSYKVQDFCDAVQFFQSAIDFQQTYNNRAYLLNEQQLYHAHMYLTNSALHVASHSYKEMEKFEWGKLEQLPNYELSSIYKIMSHNDEYLQANAFYKVTNNHVSTCSKETCEEIVDHNPPNTMILYFNDRENIVMFNGNEEALSPSRADMLRHLLLKCTKEQPGTRITFRDYFSSTGTDGEVNKKTLQKAIGRLRDKLMDIGLLSDIFGVTQHRGETGYYFNEGISCIVMFRVDDVAGSEYITR